MYTVKEILDQKGYKVVTIDPSTTVYDALKKMAGQDIGALLVLDGDNILGVFSERDYARKIVLKGKSSKESSVGELMSDRVYAVKLTTRSSECMQLMTDHRVRHLPVVDNDKLVGIVSIGDIVNSIIKDQSNTIQQLEDYIIGKR